MQPPGPPRNVNPEELAPARGFSHATVSGDTVWVGGQVGSDGTGKIVEPGDIVAQYARAMRNVAVGLGAAGCRGAATANLPHDSAGQQDYRHHSSGARSAHPRGVPPH